MAKKEKKNIGAMLMTLFIALTMILSILGYVTMDNTNTYKYNKTKFITDNNGVWITSINSQKLSFDYFPGDIDSIELSPEIKMFISGRQEIDITSDIDDLYIEEIAKASYDMANNLQIANVYVREGYTSNNTYNMPIITCNDSSNAVPVIYFKKSGHTNVTLQDYCIIAEAQSNYDVLRIKDRLIYSILGIIR